MTTKTSDPIDRRSLLRQIAVRIKWWGELDADEIIQMIKQAPKVGSEDGKKYESLTEAAEDVNGHKSNISRACADGRQYKGFTWRFAEERG